MSLADYVLTKAAQKGPLSQVKAALEAGASVSGVPGQHFAPIVLAIYANHADIVDFLVEQGVDPDFEIPCPSSEPLSLPGERILHMAARTGKVEIVRLLLT